MLSTLWSRVGRVLQRRDSGTLPSVRFDDQHVAAWINARSCWSVRWDELAEIVMFKRDLGTLDQVCLGFRCGNGSPRVFCVHEELHGWDELLTEIDRRFGGVATWVWSDVAFPAFAVNWTIVWGEPSELNDRVALVWPG